jgi:hypothetical protein
VLGLTQTGREVLDRDKRRQRAAKLDVTDAKRMENIVADSASNAVVKEKIALAPMEALPLVRRARDAWLATESEADRKKRTECAKRKAGT